MPSCCSTRQRWKRWTSPLMRSTWSHLEVRTTAGERRKLDLVSPLKHQICPMLRGPMCFCPQSRGLERGNQAGRVWERGLGPEHHSLPRCALLQHQQQPLCDRWEVRRGRVWDFVEHRPLMSLRLCSASGCSSALRVWELDPLNRKIRPTECQTGILKRAVTCIEVRRVLALVPIAVGGALICPRPDLPRR